ncbi:UTP--glucose-1-phosphate uridylyltransferase [Candidatus Shapirobacteria bacterium]|jgi:UTP--glucose-1-phosphate uridylyltransferase|nr:UTP--glucose-1-phosphate uridylyltransferase [Candidatus Shapirobacteria bacterium]
MTITKAVIAAAGRGTRFLPVVKAYPKELVPLISKPNIQYLIEEAIGAGITEIAIVHRLGENSIEKYFSPDPELEKYLTETNKLDYLDSLKNIWSQAKLTFIPQPINLPYGNGSPILAAKNFIGTDNFVYMFGDDLTVEPTPGQFLSKMMATFDQYSPASVIAVKDVGSEEISRYGSAQYMDDPNYPHRISAMLEKLPADQAPSTFAQGGRFVLNNKIISVLENQPTGQGNELWLADAQNYLAKNDVVLTQAFEGSEDWLTTGDPLRWLIANITLALNDPHLKDGLIESIKKLT